MINISDKQFEEIITEAMDSLPGSYVKSLQNVAIVWEQEPTKLQRAKLELRHDQTLFGLYEGVPRPRRGGITNLPPDKITIFKQPILFSAQDIIGLKERVRHTLWHEIAHHFGLDHKRIHELE